MPQGQIVENLAEVPQVLIHDAQVVELTVEVPQGQFGENLVEVPQVLVHGA